MKLKMATLAVMGTLFITTVPGFTHHSDVAYQRTAIELKTATIVKVAWINPHAVISCDVKDDAGKVSRWTLEMGSPSALTRAGWTKTTLKKGDQITVDAWLSKSKPDRANVKSVMLADGRELSGASSIADAKQPTNKPISN